MTIFEFKKWGKKDIKLIKNLSSKTRILLGWRPTFNAIDKRVLGSYLLSDDPSALWLMCLHLHIPAHHPPEYLWQFW